MKKFLWMLMICSFSVANAETLSANPDQNIRSIPLWIEQSRQGKIDKEKAFDRIKALTPEVRKRANSGNSDAQYGLSLIYGVGIGVMQDRPRAVKWLTEAAKNNHVVAQRALGYGYRFGNSSFPKNPEKSKEWFSKAAYGGDLDAMVRLAIFYRGVSFPQYKDLIEARVWYTKAAAKGNAYSHFMLGCYATFGWHQPTDLNKAQEHFSLSAEAGDFRAKDFVSTRNMQDLWWHCNR